LNPKEVEVALVDIASLPVIERLPGWRGRIFHSEHMTVAHYDFANGASIHEHFHPQEEIYHVLEGELELIIEGELQIGRPGLAVIVPTHARHSVCALSDGRVLIVDSPRRPDAAGRS
jgi:quercetin dioxygenase-like cupin family protein